jgi:hypothetical protein
MGEISVAELMTKRMFGYESFLQRVSVLPSEKFRNSTSVVLKLSSGITQMRLRTLSVFTLP